MFPNRCFFVRDREKWLDIIKPTSETGGTREFVMSRADAETLDIKQGLYEIVKNPKGLFKVNSDLMNDYMTVQRDASATQPYCADVFTLLSGITHEEALGSRYSLVCLSDTLPDGFRVEDRMAGRLRSI